MSTFTTRARVDIDKARWQFTGPHHFPRNLRAASLVHQELGSTTTLPESFHVKLLWPSCGQHLPRTFPLQLFPWLTVKYPSIFV